MFRAILAARAFRESRGSISRFLFYLSLCVRRTTPATAAQSRATNVFLFLLYTFIIPVDREYSSQHNCICWPARCITLKPAVGFRAPCRWIDTSICLLAAQFRAQKRIECFPSFSRHLAIRSPSRDKRLIVNIARQRLSPDFSES